MKYEVKLNKISENKTGQLSGSLALKDVSQKDRGFDFLKKGQLITGTIISVGEAITLDFQGQKVTAPKSVLQNAVPGESKTFEVVKATKQEIELRLLEAGIGKQKAFTATAVKDTDWGMVMSQKDKKARIAGKEADYRSKADKLEKLGARFTKQDYGHLEKEGFPVEGFTIDGLYEAMNRVKEDSSSESGQSEDTSEKKALAYQLSEAVGKLDDKGMQYLISRNLKPSAENIYKALYSGSIQNQPLSDEEWQALNEQTVSVIEAAGYEVNEDNLDTARWLLESGLPLTKDTFAYKKDLDELIGGYDRDNVYNHILQDMGKGMKPEEISLLPGSEASPEQIIEEINSIRPETVTEAVKEGRELTIRNLSRLQEEAAPIRNQKESADIDREEAKERYREIRAHRQLEEIRLKMTYEAASDLGKKGFRIETEELSKVVDALRELEDSYYRSFFREVDAPVTDEALDLLKETTQSVAQLKYIPNLVLARTLQDSAVQTIPELLSEGNKLKAELEKAGQAYETLMTVPNKEYGDSIQKAFAEMDSLLSEMDIENTESNQRAVKALSYNRMEINDENISRIKAYDLEVTTLIRKLHPAVTVRMIREGMNPLNMPITELNNIIDHIREEQGITSEDRFSTYLHKLEKDNAITEQERKAYIGIYRLLYNVDKSDGTALGAVIKADREVTLSNLLTAVRTIKKGGLEAVIDDEFGTLQDLTREKETIAEQLSVFGGESGQPDREQRGNDDLLAQQRQYLGRIIKQLKEDISPESLQKAGNSLAGKGQGIMGEEATAFLTQEVPLRQGIWETIKDTPVEKLFEKVQAVSESASDDVDYTAKQNELRELCNHAEQTIRFLNDYQMPGTPMNLMIASQILSNGESPIRKLLRQQEENKAEESENSLKELDELSDKLIDRQSMQETYETLEEEAHTMLFQACSQEKLDSFKLAQLKSLGQQLSFARKLAEKEFYQIPIETEKGFTNINLTIIRGSQASGRLSVTLRSNVLGSVKADFTLKDKVLKGFIGSDNREGLELLRRSTGEIEEAVQESTIHLKQMDYGTLTMDHDTYHYQYSDREEEASEHNPETERILYRLAKAIVRTVRTAENTGTKQSPAVS